MHTHPLLFFLLLPIILGQFICENKNPQIGDTVVIKCRLSSSNGFKFVSATPEMRVNQSRAFTCDQLREQMGNARFNGMHWPDLKLTNLSCDLVIFFLQESDLWTNFTCFQLMKKNGLEEYKEYSLELAQCFSSPLIPPTEDTSSPNSSLISTVIIWLLFALVSLLFGVLCGVFIRCFFYFYTKLKNVSEINNLEQCVLEKIHPCDEASLDVTPNSTSGVQEQNA